MWRCGAARSVSICAFVPVKQERLYRVAHRVSDFVLEVEGRSRYWECLEGNSASIKCGSYVLCCNPHESQYLYFGTSKASELSTCWGLLEGTSGIPGV